MKRHLLPWSGVTLLAVLSASAGSATLDEQDVQQLQRVAGIEWMLGEQLPLAELLCADESLGRRRLPQAGSAAAQRLQDQLRSTLEQCRLTAAAAGDGDDKRLVAQMRTALLARIAQLQPVRAALEQCRKAKSELTQLRACVAGALGRPASSDEIAALTQRPP